MTTKTEVKDFEGNAIVFEHDGSDMAWDFINKRETIITQQQKAIATGVPALERLMEIAERNASGQARYISLFLLGLYNGPRFPFDLTNLRAIDGSLQDDCLAVLEMDAKACLQEVHEYFTNGDIRFEKFAKRFEATDV